MKMSRRIFMILLTFAVVLSSFVLFASADEAEAQATEIKDFSYILDYYEEPVIFGYDFVGADFDYNDALMLKDHDRVTHSVVTDATAPGGKYLGIEITGDEPWGVDNVFLNWNSEDGVDDFYLDATVFADSIDDFFFLPKYRLILNDTAFTDISNSLKEGVAILTLDFHFERFSYLSGVDATGKPVETVADYHLTADTWYTISLDYSATNGTASITLTNANDSSDTVTVTDVYVPFELVKNVRFGVHSVDYTDMGENVDGSHDSSGNVLKIANLTAAGGSVRRNTSDRQKGLDDTILEIYSVYTSPDIDVDSKTVLCEIVNKLLSYGFTTENPDVQAAVDDIRVGSVTLYSNALANGLSDLKQLDNYYDKRAKVDKTLEYVVVLEDMDLSPVGAEAAAVIRDNMAALKAADEYLKAVEADSIAYIDILKGAEADSKSTDYNVLLGYYDAVAVLSPDLTYDGVAAVHEYYLAIVNSMDEIAYESEAFIREVNRLGDTSRDFMLRYADYLKFKDNVSANETYPGVVEAITLYNDVVLPDILYNINLAESFVMYIERANFSTYISAKEENIRLADEYIDICHPDFDGVAEAKALRLRILDYIEEQKGNAQAYIDAVNALDSLTGNALTEGIAKAEKLQKTGNVLGVDGVTEANIKLNQITSEIKLRDKYCKYFITLVEELAYVYELEARYVGIIEALAAERKADPTYPGVADASLDLEYIIEDYNAAVEEVNGEFVMANFAASNTVGIGTTSNSVADNVIAIIQNFFYEEEEDGSDEEESE